MKPDTEYEAVPKTRPNAGQPQDAAGLASWIESAVLGDLRTLKAGVDIYLHDVDRRVEARLGGGNFLLAAGCLMALEYIARIFHGQDDSMKNVREYAATFLKPIDSRYAEVADLLWRAFRNGLIHGSWPQTICSSTSDQRVRVGVGVEASEQHLGPEPTLPGTNFVLNAIQLLSDLEQSVSEGFVPWLRKQPANVLMRGAPRLLIVNQNDQPGLAQFDLLVSWNKTAKSAG